MKLIILLMITAILQVSAGSFAQKISIKKTDALLVNIFDEISNQTGYDFIVTSQVLRMAKPVTIHVANAELDDVLKMIFDSQPLTYKVEDKIIIVSRRTFPLKQAATNRLSISVNYELSGTVTNEKGEKLPGVVIKVSNTYIATVTDKDGFYRISVPPKAVVVFSYLGMKPKTLTLDETSESSKVVNIQLETDEAKLDQVEVVGYGTTTRRSTTGSLARVTAAEIERQPVSNPIQALQGRVAGVLINESSGIAGSGLNIVVQGRNTISAGQRPLYIVDGVPFGGAPIEQTSGTYDQPISIIGNGFDPLNTLSPNDIESITILKDADATAIYGSRAANGVVVITTKKGKINQTKLDIDLYSGVNEATRTLPLLNADQYLSIRKQAFVNDGITPDRTNAPDLTTFNTGGNTDFQKFLIGNTGNFTNASVALSGGNEQTQFLVSTNFRHETTILPKNFGDTKVQVRFNIQHHTKDNKFSINASASYTKDNNNLAPVNLARDYNLPPNIPVYKDNGMLDWYTGYRNPAASLENIYSANTRNLLANASLNYNIGFGLSFKTDLGYNSIGIDKTVAALLAAANPASAGVRASATLSNNTNELYTIEPQLNYSVTLGKGKLEALVGGTYQRSQLVQPYYVSGTLANDALYRDFASITPFLTGSGFNENKYVSAFGRLNYNWDGKYILSGNFRRDGSSRFAPNNRFGNFGSIGAAWLFSEESFVKDNFSWLSFGKLRSSYGSIGNDQIQDYGYLSLYFSSPFSYSGENTITPVGLSNDSNYSWEVTKKLNFSLDLGFIKDRILLTATYYRNRTSNLLLNSGVPLPSQTGFSGYTGNLPGILVQNRGLELELNTVNVKSKNLTWKTSVNFTAPQNKLLAFPGLQSSSFATGFPGQGFVIGKSLNSLIGYEYTGTVNGSPTVRDLNGDGQITPGLAQNNQGDFQVLGSSNPKFYGGLGNSITYKNFQLDFLFQFVKQKAYNAYYWEYAFSNTYPGGGRNLPADILKYNFTYSTKASSDLAQAYQNEFQFSSAAISDASYIRLKNISLAYSLNPVFIKHLGMKSGNIYIRGQNLLTITNYLGIDPETGALGVPPLKSFTIGLQASF